MCRLMASLQLSSAGFYYSPNEDEEDCVTCIYCQCSLGGWEKSDDPVEEHQKRRPECPVFNSVLEKEERKAESKSTKKANTSVAKSRAASRKRAAENDELDSGQESKLHEDANAQGTRQTEAVVAPEEEKPEADDKPAPIAKSAAGRKRAAPKAKKTTTRKKAANPEEDEPQPARKSKKPKLAVNSEEAVGNAESSVPLRDVNEKTAVGENPEEAVVDASDFEDEPTQSHEKVPSDMEKRAVKTIDARKTRDSETFKTPKQTMSGRTTVAAENTPKASSPASKSQSKAAPEVMPLGDIAPLTKLDAISNEEKLMTVEDWLKVHVTKACTDMENEGQKRIAKLRIRMDQGRKQAECILRGIDVNMTS